MLEKSQGAKKTFKFEDDTKEKSAKMHGTRSNS